MKPEYESYIRERFATAAVNSDPFPHLAIRNVLPPALYTEMQEALPSAAEVRRAFRRELARRVRQRPPLRFWRMKLDPVLFYIHETARTAYGLDHYGEVWADRFGAYIELVETLAHRSLNIDDWTVGPRCFFFRPTGWAIKPHNHGSQELLNLLLYFPTPDNTPDQGTIFYRLHDQGHDLGKHAGTQEFDPRLLEPARIVPYIQNSLVAWINSQDTIHGSVEIAGAPARQYLYINSTRP